MNIPREAGLGMHIPSQRRVSRSLGALFVALCSSLSLAQDLRSTLEGLVFEVEEWTTPKDAWQQDKTSPDKWNLWTKEEDVFRKRSKGASLQSPRVEADRATPEEGAPPLHTVITGIPNGLYRVRHNPPNRAMAVSFDGKTWVRRGGQDRDLGFFEIDDGTFELWVDDRYANPGNLGTCYYDYLQFLEAKPPEFSHFAAFVLPDGRTQLSWITDEPLATGVVEFGTDGKFDQQAESPLTGMRNHRVVVGRLDSKKEYSARIRVGLNAGKAFVSPVFTFTPKAPRPTGPSEVTDIPLMVAEPTQWSRKSWPVVSGVPFAQGALLSPTHAHVRSARGLSLPFWCAAASQWPDGSVRWLTVEAVIDTHPQQPRELALHIGPVADGLRPGVGRPRVMDSPDELVVSNGRLRFHVGKRAFALFDQVSLDVNGDGEFSPDELVTSEPLFGNGRIVPAGEKPRGLAPPDEVVVEQETPIRTVVCVSGSFVNAAGEKLFRYRARITCFAAQPWLKLEWTIGNDNVDDVFTELDSAALRIPVRGEGPVEGTLDGRRYHPVQEADDLWLLQDSDSHVQTTTRGATTEGQRAAGFASVQKGKWQVSAFVRDFWQTYPKGLAVKPDGLHVRLLPELPDDLYADHKPEDVLKWSYWYRGGKYRFKRGMEYTSTMYVYFGKPEVPLEQLAAHFQNPLFAVAPPEHYCASGAFGPVLPAKEGQFDAYEGMAARGFERLQQNREAKREYGWMNYGDWHGERHDNWGNSEYDLHWGLGLQFARTGDLRYLWRGAERARHNTSIDTIHYPWSPTMRGLVYEHCVGHVGDFFTKDDARVKEWSGIYGRGIINGAIDPQGHVFQEGNFLYGNLLCDPRFTEVAERVVGQQATYVTPNFNFGIERAAGWPLICALSAYENTNNPFYLNAARLYLEKIYELQDPETGGWRMRQGKPECDCPDQPHVGGKTFATGILLCGLVRYEAIDSTPEVRQCLVRACDWLMNDAWDPVGKGFRYKTGCPKYARSSSIGASGALIAMGLTRASELTGAPKYRDFMLSWIKRAFDGTPGNGKSYAMMLHQSVYALRDLREQGITELPEPTAVPEK